MSIRAQRSVYEMLTLVITQDKIIKALLSGKSIAANALMSTPEYQFRDQIIKNAKFASRGRVEPSPSPARKK